jgi:hypothetical protein
MKNKLLILFLIISIVTNLLLFWKKGNEKKENIIFEYDRHKDSYNLPLTQSASCNFEKDVSVEYPESSKTIRFTLNRNTQPINISFINIDTDIPIMRGNAGQDDLLKVVDNDDIVTMIEKSPLTFGTLQSFSIFKKSGVGIWTKQYDLFGTPFGLVSMGYCD